MDREEAHSAHYPVQKLSTVWTRWRDSGIHVIDIQQINPIHHVNLVYLIIQMIQYNVL